MRLRATANPTTTPVTLADAKADLPVIHASDDTKIQLAIDAALAHLGGCDGITGRAIAKQAFALTLDTFPCGRIVLPVPPLVSVESITYIDPNGATQTLAPSAYRVELDGVPGRIAPVDAWPSTSAKGSAVTVAFTAGYDTAPAALRSALLLLVRDIYNEEPGKHDATIDRLVAPLQVFGP